MLTASSENDSFCVDWSLIYGHMNKQSTQDQEYAGIDFRTNGFERGEYDNCTFNNCTLASVSLTGCIFVECRFINCDLSMAVLQDASFRDVIFRNCKMLGARFDECSKFLLAFRFESCILNFSSFYRLKLKGTSFKDCKLQEAEFTETDLTNAKLDDCDLLGARFENTLLEGADLRTAYNYSMDPERNHLTNAKFSLSGVVGLLDKYKIKIE